MPNVEIRYDTDGDWAALYVDGQLERVGDAYLAEEKAFEILGVKTLRDNAFLRGQTQASGVAPTLTEVEAYRTERDAARARATALREQAAALLAEADGLAPPKKG